VYDTVVWGPVWYQEYGSNQIHICLDGKHSSCGKRTEDRVSIGVEKWFQRN